MSSRASMKRKVLLMGKSGSGKTSMRSIIFANYLARDTMRLGPTLGVENSHVRFLGSLVLNLWDMGGQDSFMTNYFDSQRDQIFRNVEVVIYVFDIESGERRKDVAMFGNCLAALRQHSKSAHIFCLLHKMDLLHKPEEKQRVFLERSQELEQLAAQHGFAGSKLRCFGTSIWDETLYKAWSSIVYALVPNVGELETLLKKFLGLLGADEIVLFERATFLVIASAQSAASAADDRMDQHRFEKISNIIKQFKLSCSKAQSAFTAMQCNSMYFTTYIRQFTANTNIMVINLKRRIEIALPDKACIGQIVITDKQAGEPAAVQMNLQVAKQHFEKFSQSG